MKMTMSKYTLNYNEILFTQCWPLKSEKIDHAEATIPHINWHVLKLDLELEDEVMWDML